jgi:hypothetical protein
MRKLIFALIAMLPLIVNAQAHLGSSESEIKQLHSDKTFETGYTDDGIKYISAYMVYGTFVYYFDKETGLSSFCMQLIYEIPYLNGQVEAYNKKYVIISDTKWKAYLEGGGILNIELTYNEENKLYVFYYTN